MAWLVFPFVVVVDVVLAVVVVVSGATVTAGVMTMRCDTRLNCPKSTKDGDPLVTILFWYNVFLKYNKITVFKFWTKQ